MFMLLIKFIVLDFEVFVVIMFVRYEFCFLVKMMDCMFGCLIIMLMMVNLVLG